MIVAPLLSPPGEFRVRVSVQDDSGAADAALVSLSVQPPTPVPLGVIPVILLNGYETFFSDPLQFSSCPVGSAQGTFGGLPAALNQTGLSYFFDNCADCPNCPIESLGADLGAFLNLLRYTDGTPVPQADVVGHSMGGLIVRAYLSGKQTTAGSFVPPASTKIRKAVFIGTPHFGSFLATLVNTGNQAVEMSSGSQFLWDLNRWNQGYDNLREVDALAIAGNGFDSGKSDGVVSLTSATIAFAGSPDDRTRVINGACHIDSFVLCATSQGIATATLTQQIVLSFLSGSSSWTTMGETPSQLQSTASSGGRYFSYVSAAGVPQTSVGSVTFGGQSLTENPDTHTTFYNDFLTATSGFLTFIVQGQSHQASIAIPAGGYGTTLVKDPPVMTRVALAPGQIDTLNIAPGSLISIFGAGLAASTATASFPWPTQLADVSLTANGQALQLLYAGSSQINAYFPSNLSGLVTLRLANAAGQHSLNVMTTIASPAIFSADSSGTGLAAAVHASTGQYVTSGNPAAPGEYIEIYGTGFGSTYPSGGLEVTTLPPTLYMGNTTATVTFSGMPPGGIGLYQINFIVPDGLPSGNVALAIAVGNYMSNSLTLPVR